MDNNKKAKIKEMLEELWSEQREFMKKLTGDENAKMDILDEWMDEKYPDEEDEE